MIVGQHSLSFWTETYLLVRFLEKFKISKLTYIFFLYSTLPRGEFSKEINASATIKKNVNRVSKKSDLQFIFS